MEEIDLSNMKLYCGYCLEIMKEIPDNSIDMVLCDLPYGVTENAWDKKIELATLFSEYERVSRKNAAILLFATQPFATDLINANRKNFRYDIVWEKTMSVGYAQCWKMPMRKHESVLVFYKHLPIYKPQGLIKTEPIQCKKYKNKSPNKSTVYRDGTLDKQYISEYKNFPKSIVTFSNGNNKNFHPTQKPTPLLEYLIKTYTNEGCTVLDNCMGSGSTVVACMNTDRNFVGIELDKEYFETAKNRIENEIYLNGQEGVVKQ